MNATVPDRTNLLSPSRVWARLRGRAGWLGALTICAAAVVAWTPSVAAAAETTRASVSSAGTEGNGGSQFAAISADGRYVAFESVASNLAPGDGNGALDVFVRDRLIGETSLASVNSSGSPGNNHSYAASISGDGSEVAFESWASNLVSGDANAGPDIFVRDRQAGATTRVSVSSSGAEGNDWSQEPAISPDGGWVAFESLGGAIVVGSAG